MSQVRNLSRPPRATILDPWSAVDFRCSGVRRAVGVVAGFLGAASLRALEAALGDAKFLGHAFDGMVFGFSRASNATEGADGERETCGHGGLMTRSLPGLGGALF